MCCLLSVGKYQGLYGHIADGVRKQDRSSSTDAQPHTSMYNMLLIQHDANDNFDQRRVQTGTAVF